MTNDQNKSLLKITCNKCKYSWNYKGKSIIYVTCPQCKYNVNVQKLKGGVNKDVENG